jgi:hypothetical protein
MRTRRRLLATAVTMALGLFPAAAAWAQGTSLEYVIKANYLYKFTPFVEWPAGAFASPSSAFNLCVVGQDPFGSALDEAVQGRTVGQHPIVVRRLPAAEAEMNCHLMFAGRSPLQSTAQMLQTVAGRPVLTVTDQDGGGVIRFVMQDGKVRFDVDTTAAQAGGIVISSKLLGLAVSRRRTAP